MSVITWMVECGPRRHRNHQTYIGPFYSRHEAMQAANEMAQEQLGLFGADSEFTLDTRSGECIYGVNRITNRNISLWWKPIALEMCVKAQTPSIESRLAALERAAGLA